MTVHVLRPDESAFSINRQVALVGFSLRGEEVRLFDIDDFDNLPLAQTDMVVGGIGVVRRAFKRLGLEAPVIDSVPQTMAELAGRKIWRCPIIDARHAVERGASLFIKPLPAQLKQFTGQPLRQFSDLLPTSHLPDDTIVECAELTPFASEYRAFVMHGEIIGLRHYSGDYLTFPDTSFIREAVAKYHDAPAGYALDVGVAEDGRTLLVEVNDGYAIGSYGLPPLRYAALIAARWEELRHRP
ncbi:MAG: ATP-grasp domain-containing protein [Rhodobacteraceae bacterium]|nr:ATP-grasp domain-containing protein [Paracoccaceae bacterium]